MNKTTQPKKGMRSRTPWKVKMLKPAEPQFVEMPEIWAKKMGNGPLLIPTPKRIAEVVNGIPILQAGSFGRFAGMAVFEDSVLVDYSMIALDGTE